MLEYLSNYIQDFELQYLKEQYTDEVLNILEIEKEMVIDKIKKILGDNKNADIYLELSTNIDKFI